MSAPLITPIRLAGSLLFLGMGGGVLYRYRLPFLRDLALGAVRAAAQLTAVGFVLGWIFARDRLSELAAALGVMLLVATWTAAKRTSHAPPRRQLAFAALLAISAGTVAALAPTFLIVLPEEGRWNGRTLIPLSGMILGNAMNVVAQVFERIFASLHRDRAIIEQWLSLGASPKRAVEDAARAVLRGSLLPIVNSLATVGLVALPGMMTGQILDGGSPAAAVRYQLVIMYALVAVAAVSGAVALLLARRLAFDERERLRRF